LRLGDEISWIKEDLPVNLDLTEGKLDKLLINNCNSRQLAEESPFILQPNKFVLGRTLERVHLPIREPGQCLAARIEGRSSYARCGLLVHFTAPTIHTGFDGTITLEIMNLGKYSIALKPFVYICQLIIERVEGKPFRNDSQFQGQTSQLGTTG
jgi:dCTP deaminase